MLRSDKRRWSTTRLIVSAIISSQLISYQELNAPPPFILANHCNSLHFSVIPSKLLQCYRKCCRVCPPPAPPAPRLEATVPPPEVTLIVCDSSISLLPCIYSTFLPPYHRAMNHPDNRCLHLVMDCFFLPHPLDPRRRCAEMRNRFHRTKPPIKDQTLFYLFIFRLREAAAFVLTWAGLRRN